MNKRNAVSTAVMLMLMLGAAASAANAKQAGKAVLLPSGEVKWADVPGFPGVQMAALGDADCVLAIDARGKWDVVPENGKGGGKK